MTTIEPRKEYRVAWKREGQRKKYRRFAQKKFADRWIILLTNPEPWIAFGFDGEDYECCDGVDCGCGGVTIRDCFERRAANLPKLVWYERQEREVGEWK